MNHFVVLKSVIRNGIVVHDPAWGERFYPLPEASKHLTGVALELAPAEGFIAKDERARLPLSVFWTHLSGSGHALVQVLVLSILLQALVLTVPFYMQLTIDEVITRGDSRRTCQRRSKARASPRRWVGARTLALTSVARTWSPNPVVNATSPKIL
jgi:ATP-binding cassette, subfamily B, bacterial CvaB/MchF/RaxB